MVSYNALSKLFDQRLLKKMFKNHQKHNLLYRYTCRNISEKDLRHMSIEFVVKDRCRGYRVGFKNQTIGQIRIGPNYDHTHWNEMLVNHGELVKKEHLLREV